MPIVKLSPRVIHPSAPEQPLGVVIAPACPPRKAWLTAADLADIGHEDAENTPALRQQIDALRDTGP